MPRPILILQHLSSDGPAYFGTWLQRQGLRFETRNTEAGDPYPARLNAYSGLCILGGEMSANDDLPSLRQAEALVRQAVAEGVPVIGHCLGGQLMARALGARVVASPAAEIGWHEVQRCEGALAEAWWGPAPSFTACQWHAEAFELPASAVPLARSAACPHQAFAIGPHLAMQFHLEIDAEKWRHWVAQAGEPYLQAMRQRHGATVQGSEAMAEGLARHLAAHQALADRVYHRWASALPA